MKHDRADIILQLAYLEGKITTRGLAEQVVMRSRPAEKMSDETAGKIHSRLCAALDERFAVEAAKGALTLGEYVSAEIEAAPGRKKESAMYVLAEKAGCTIDEISRLCRDEMSPVELGARRINLLLRFLELPLRTATMLLKNSIRCARLAPSLASTLARYDSRRGGRKPTAMRRAVRELYIKADLDLSPAEEQETDEFIRRATEGCKS